MRLPVAVALLAATFSMLLDWSCPSVLLILFQILLLMHWYPNNALQVIRAFATR